VNQNPGHDGSQLRIGMFQQALLFRLRKALRRST
jgi:hypothetical protein